MGRHQQQLKLQRSRSYNCKHDNTKITPTNHTRSPSSPFPSIPDNEQPSPYNNTNLLIAQPRPRNTTSFVTLNTFHHKFFSFFRSLLNIITNVNVPPQTLTETTITCKWLTLPSHSSSSGHVPSLGRRVTGTLFGFRRGHVSFALQDNPRSPPVILLELAMSTSTLIKEMSSGLVRIALECEKGHKRPAVGLLQEPVWSMYCNGRKCGYTVSRRGCTESDWHVLSTVSRVSVGAGVIPVLGGGKEEQLGELLYMRAKFERAVGSRDSEAFYMLNPDRSGGPELSIFLLRV